MDSSPPATPFNPTAFCPHCQGQMSLAGLAPGQAIACPHCGGALLAPALATPAIVPPAPPAAPISTYGYVAPPPPPPPPPTSRPKSEEDFPEIRVRGGRRRQRQEVELPGDSPTETLPPAISPPAATPVKLPAQGNPATPAATGSKPAAQVARPVDKAPPKQTSPPNPVATPQPVAQPRSSQTPKELTRPSVTPVAPLAAPPTMGVAPPPPVPPADGETPPRPLTPEQRQRLRKRMHLVIAFGSSLLLLIALIVLTILSS